MHKRLAIFLVVLVAFAADARAVTIATVPVGNPGNPANSFPDAGLVAYDLRIGEYDVTLGQYTAFLNSVATSDPYGLYVPFLASNLNIAGIARSGESGSYSYSVIGSANHPVTYVTWGDAARFSNWLNNGQPTGAEGPSTTETGAYTLNGAVTRAALDAVTRNPGATWFIPNENEWYKAAYYNPATSTYYLYPTSSNTPPGGSLPSNTPNTANLVTNGMYAVMAVRLTTTV